MDRIKRWKLADELNAFQIALLISGYDPSEFEGDVYDRWPNEVKAEISAYLNAIKNAARGGKLAYTQVKYEEFNEIDWNLSTIHVDSFCDWMRSRNFVDGFFITDATSPEGLADASSVFYAPKLAAAVRAWNEVTSNPESSSGKTPKKALEIWLRKHANEYGLTNKDGNPNELGIEEICKVANWKPAGGASRTPTPTSTQKPPEGSSQWGRKERPWGRGDKPKPPTPKVELSLDDDIPF